jgi:hypothetical protein
MRTANLIFAKNSVPARRKTRQTPLLQRGTCRICHFECKAGIQMPGGKAASSARRTLCGAVFDADETGLLRAYEWEP